MSSMKVSRCGIRTSETAHILCLGMHAAEVRFNIHQHADAVIKQLMQRGQGRRFDLQ